MDSSREDRSGRVNNRWTEVGVDVAWHRTHSGTLPHSSIVVDNSVMMSHDTYTIRNCTEYNHFIVEFNRTDILNAHCMLHILRSNSRIIIKITLNERHYRIRTFIFFYLAIDCVCVCVLKLVIILEHCYYATILHRALFKALFKGNFALSGF